VLLIGRLFGQGVFAQKVIRKGNLQNTLGHEFCQPTETKVIILLLFCLHSAEEKFEMAKL